MIVCANAEKRKNLAGDELLTAHRDGPCRRPCCGARRAWARADGERGRAVAEAAVAVAPRAGAAIAMLAGPATMAAMVSWRRGCCASRDIRCARTAWQPRIAEGDAAAMAQRWGEPVEPLDATTVAGADLIIDALFGAGLSRPLDGIAADVVAAINVSGTPVVAVDVPSGLDGTTGTSSGPVVQATCTVTFLPAEAWAPAPAGARPVRRGARGRHRHPRAGAAGDRCTHLRQSAAPCGARRIPGRASMGTSTRAVTRSWCPARRKAQVRHAWARVVRCVLVPPGYGRRVGDGGPRSMQRT
jgi:NAD(P)H-hydrate repair Nnr-like enzyme with NAD(P)H-hydrate epimerase domain